MARKLKTSTEGYKSTSPDRNNPMNLIPSGRISMQDVNFPVMGVDEFGNAIMMKPNGEYSFPGNSVMEFPMKDQEEFKKGGSKKTTHKNIKTSRNQLMKRNYDLYGEAGTKEYKPLFEDGGFTDNFLKKTIALHTESLNKKAPKQNDFQSVTTDDYIAKQKDEFTAYLQRNTMNQMIQEEQQFLTQKPVMDMMRMGGAYELSAFMPKAQMGMQTGQPDFSQMTPAEFTEYQLRNKMVTQERTQPIQELNPNDPASSAQYSPFATFNQPSTYGPGYSAPAPQQTSNPNDPASYSQYSPFATFETPSTYGPGYAAPTSAKKNFEIGADESVATRPPYAPGQQPPNADDVFGQTGVQMPNNLNVPNTTANSVTAGGTKQPNFWQNLDGEDKTNLAITGANTISSLLERGEAERRKRELEKLMTADNTFAVRPASAASRGDWDTNSGVLRPDKYVATQFGAYGKQNAFSGAYKHGGQHNIGDEIDMSDLELAQFLAAGGQVEYL